MAIDNVDTGDVVKCGECEAPKTIDEDGYAECWGTRSYQHSKRTVVRPCGVCGDPIRTAEICTECADESDISVVDPVWGH